MHFKSPRLFVMWDTEIRKRYRIPNEGPDRAHVAHDPASDKVSLRRNLSAQEAIRVAIFEQTAIRGRAEAPAAQGQAGGNVRGQHAGSVVAELTLAFTANNHSPRAFPF